MAKVTVRLTDSNRIFIDPTSNKALTGSRVMTFERTSAVERAIDAKTLTVVNKGDQKQEPSSDTPDAQANGETEEQRAAREEAERAEAARREQEEANKNKQNK